MNYQKRARVQQSRDVVASENSPDSVREADASSSLLNQKQGARTQSAIPVFPAHIQQADVKANVFSNAFIDKSRGEKHAQDVQAMAVLKDENVHLHASLLSAHHVVGVHKLQLQKALEERDRLNQHLDECEHTLASLTSSSDVASTTSQLVSKALSQTVAGHLSVVDEMKRRLADRSAEVDKLSELVNALNTDLKTWQLRYGEVQMRCEAAESALAETRDRLLAVEESHCVQTEGPRRSLLTSCLLQTEQRLQESESEVCTLQLEVAATKAAVAESQSAFYLADVEAMALKHDLERVTSQLEQKTKELDEKVAEEKLCILGNKDAECQPDITLHDSSAQATADSMDATCQPDLHVVCHSSAQATAGSVDATCQPDTHAVQDSSAQATTVSVDATCQPDSAAASAAVEATQPSVDSPVAPRQRPHFGLFSMLRALLLHGTIAIVAVLATDFCRSAGRDGAHTEAGQPYVRSVTDAARRMRKAAGLEP